ncbi:hypothetical protein [Bacteroides sp.]|uniref:hypothetical protein n=1 Tax=Bacteroides sp. TaxID=29523 RepID=UPI003AB2C0DC
MEDIFKFLLVAAVIVIGIAKQFKKETKKNDGKKPAMPRPAANSPLPEQWGGETYGGYIPQGPGAEVTLPVEKEKTVAQYKASRAKDYGPATATSSTINSTSSRQKGSSPPSGLQESEEPSEFSIHSAEEARQAIIWSEILQRKY